MKSRKRNILFLAGGIVLLVVVMVVAFIAMRMAAMNQWLEEDSEGLKPFDTVLVQDSERMAIGELSEIDHALVEELSEDRLVADMTRSDYRYGLFGKDAYVKVHMVTLKPGDESVRIQIKLLIELEKSDGDWAVSEVEELALP